MLRIALQRTTGRATVSTFQKWTRYSSSGTPTTSTNGSEALFADVVSKDESLLKEFNALQRRDNEEDDLEEPPDLDQWRNQSTIVPGALYVDPNDPNPQVHTEHQWAQTVIHGRSMYPAYRHPITHDIPVAAIHFRSHDPKKIEFFAHFAMHAASALGIPMGGLASLPTQRSLWTVIKGPFAHKKSQENFDRRVHKRALKAFDAHPEVIDRYFAYLRQHALGGVGMRFTKWNHYPVGIGAMHAKKVGRMMRDLDSEKVMKLAEEIVRKEEISWHKEAGKQKKKETHRMNKQIRKAHGGELFYREGEEQMEADVVLDAKEVSVQEATEEHVEQAREGDAEATKGTEEEVVVKVQEEVVEQSKEDVVNETVQEEVTTNES